MRDRYVTQVLLVTLGFGVLLGLIAVVDTPRDWSQQPTIAATPVQQDGRRLPEAERQSRSLEGPASGDLTSSGRMASHATPRYVMSPRVVDLDDRSDSPLDDSSDQIQALPWQNCDHAGHKKACEDAGPSTKTGKIHHC